MAVIAPPPFRSQPDLWGSVDASTFDIDPAGPMTHMPYQYSPPPPAGQNGANMDMAPGPGYVSEYSNHPASADMDPRASMESSSQGLERSNSYSKSLKLRRSMSTPSVNPGHPAPPAEQMDDDVMGADAAALALASEKRRNKLGYHRTSVACGHCRRRKIRCIPSPADVQGRCVNCIRLKKECSFYPVDQQPPPDVRSKTGSRSSVGTKISSASSSPALPPGMPTDIPPHAHFAQLAVGSVQPMAPPSGKPPSGEAFSHDGRMPPNMPAGRNSFDYGHAGSMTTWVGGDGSTGPSKPADLPATWRSYPSGSPVTTAFSPYTPTTPAHSSTWTGPVPADAAREDLGWSSYPAPPARSMSFGTAESMNQHHQQYQTMPQGGQAVASRGYDRKSASMSEMYPPPLASTVPEYEPGVPSALEHHGIPAEGIPQPTYASWQQPYGYAKQGDSYGTWYAEGGGQHMSPEEHVQQSTDHGQPGSGLYYSGR